MHIFYLVITSKHYKTTLPIYKGGITKCVKKEWLIIPTFSLIFNKLQNFTLYYVIKTRCDNWFTFALHRWLV